MMMASSKPPLITPLLSVTSVIIGTYRNYRKRKSSAMSSESDNHQLVPSNEGEIEVSNQEVIDILKESEISSPLATVADPIDVNILLNDLTQTLDELDLSKGDFNLSFDANVFEDSEFLSAEKSETSEAASVTHTQETTETEKRLAESSTICRETENMSSKKLIPKFYTALNRLAVYSHPLCMKHHIPNHPEQPKRVEYILKTLQKSFLNHSNVSFREATMATEDHIRLFHTYRVLDSFLKKWEDCQQIYDKQRKVVYRNIDGDTEVMYATKDAAYYAAGSIINAIDHIFLPKEDSLSIDTAFCCVRPPGHHAEPNRSGGFCFFNNAGIGALYAREKYGVNRVAVLDFDVHHGNGTEEGFKDDENLFYGSTHQKHCYPGTGPDPSPFIGDKAKSPIHRRIVDRQLTPGNSSRKEFRMKWIQVLEEMELFRPELIIVSAGFDAHDDDPLADVELIDDDYSWATIEILKSGLRINSINPPRIISILEGGYDLDAISRSALLHVQRLYDGYESVVEDTESGKGHNGDEVEALKEYMKDLFV